jgi:hypothetical protein
VLALVHHREFVLLPTTRLDRDIKGPARVGSGLAPSRRRVAPQTAAPQISVLKSGGAQQRRLEAIVGAASEWQWRA